MLTPLLNSLLLVAIAEMGDKTQLLAMLLAARFRAPVPILAGIFIATLFNHGFSALLGQWMGDMLEGNALRYAVAALFIGIGLWVLVPDKDGQPIREKGGAFATTLVVFFLAEMGDKTQLATVTLGATYAGHLAMVTLGTTLGMMAANAPAVFFGQRLSRLPMAWIRRGAALCFIGFGILALLY